MTFTTISQEPGQYALLDRVGSFQNEMVDALAGMVQIKSIAPKSGGEGESKRADFLQKTLESWGFSVTRYDYKDDKGFDRSNLVVRFGDAERTLWIVSHIDTVSEGDPKLWASNPFRAEVRGGKIYGRGVLDNGQSAIASMFALRALKESGANLKYNFGLVLVADEELGSEYGIQKLISEGIFGKRDLFIVPDWSQPQGDKIEVAEKSILWVKFTLHGKQVHASTPELGLNAFRYMVNLLKELDAVLHQKYSVGDQTFNPPVSTFEMTKHEKNVDSTNIIPGTEVFYMDCRVLPQYKLEGVMADIRETAKRVLPDGVGLEMENLQYEEAAPPTDTDAEVVRLLRSTIKSQRNIDATPVGIGGGTCAAYFRRAGFPAVVWSTGEDIAHEPNEFIRIKDMVDDAKVFAGLFV